MFFNVDDFLEADLDEEGMPQMPVDFDTGEDLAMSDGSDLTELPIDQIVFLPEIYPRSLVDRERVTLFAELMTYGQVFPPLRVTKNGDGYILLDGKHRLDALKAIGKTTAAIEVVRAEDKRTWKLRYAYFNREGSEPLSKKDLKRNIQSALQRGTTIKEIAQFLGYPTNFINDLVHEQPD